MSRASDILRERAMAMGHSRSLDQRREAAELRAVAVLLDAVTRRQICVICWSELEDEPHEDWCTCAALERAITGESDATSE
jgi:hypothetical protein